MQLASSYKNYPAVLCKGFSLDFNKLFYLIDSLLDLTETNIEVHLLLLQLTTFLIEQVGILIDKVQVVARSDGHRVASTFGQAVVSLLRNENILNILQTGVLKVTFWIKQSVHSLY